MMLRRNSYLKVLSSTRLFGEGEVGSLFQSNSCRKDCSLLQTTYPISFLKSLAKVRSWISCCTCYSFHTSFCRALRSRKTGRPSWVTIWLVAAIDRREGSFSATRRQSQRVLTKYARSFSRKPYSNSTSGGHLVTSWAIDILRDRTFLIMYSTSRHISSERSNLPLKSLMWAQSFSRLIASPLSSRIVKASSTQQMPVFILRLTDSLQRGKRSSSQFKPTPVSTFLMYSSCGSGFEKKLVKKPLFFAFTLPSFIFCTSSLQQLKSAHPSQSSSFSSSFSCRASNSSKQGPIFSPLLWQSLARLGCGVLLARGRTLRAVMQVLLVNLAKKKVVTMLRRTRLMLRWVCLGKLPCSSTCPSSLRSTRSTAGKLASRGRSTLLVKALRRRESAVGLSRNAKRRSARYLSCPSSSPSRMPLVNSCRKTAICRSVRNPLPTCRSLISAASCSRHWRAVTVTSSSRRSAEASVATAERRGKEGQRELQKSFMSELLP